MINTGWVTRVQNDSPVTSLHFWVINTLHALTDFRCRPVTSLHFWVINTYNPIVFYKSPPVTSLHFWVINTVEEIIIDFRLLSLAYIFG